MSIYSEAFRTAFRETGLVQSLGGTGDCFDNARMESFFCDILNSRIPSGKEIPRPTDVCRFVLRISGLRTLIQDGECHSLFSQ